MRAISIRLEGEDLPKHVQGAFRLESRYSARGREVEVKINGISENHQSTIDALLLKYQVKTRDEAIDLIYYYATPPGVKRDPDDPWETPLPLSFPLRVRYALRRRPPEQRKGAKCPDLL